MRDGCDSTAEVGGRPRGLCGQLRAIISDDGRGWLAVVCVLLALVLQQGPVYSFGIIIVDMMDEYEGPLAEQNWITNLSKTIMFLLSPVFVMLARRFPYHGYRAMSIIGSVLVAAACMASSMVPRREWLFLTYSLTYGIGNGLSYMSGYLLVEVYFRPEHKYHVFATSVLWVAYPISSVVFNPVIAVVVSALGWRSTFRVFGGILFVLGVLCSLPLVPKVRPDKSPDQVGPSRPSPPRRTVSCHAWSHIKEKPETLLWYLGYMLIYAGLFILYTNLAYYLTQKGISSDKAALVLLSMSLAEAVTYVVCAAVGDRLKGRLVYCSIAASFCLAVLYLLWPFIDVSYEMILFWAILVGCGHGLGCIYAYPASGEVTEQSLDEAWGYSNFFCGFGLIIAPIVSGSIYDIRRSFDDLFYVVSGAYWLAFFLFLPIPIIKHIRKTTTVGSKCDHNNMIGSVSNETSQSPKHTQYAFVINKVEEGIAMPICNANAQYTVCQLNPTGSTLESTFD